VIVRKAPIGNPELMNDKTQNNPAEIDLFYFFRPLSRLFKKAGAGLVYSVRKMFYNKFLFASVVIILTLAGFSLRYILPPGFETQGIFISNTLSGRYCSLLLKNLNKLKSDENRPILAQQLGLSLEAAKDIRSIRLSSMSDTFALQKKDTTLSLFRITLILASMDHLPDIQKALVNYLENNEYAMKRKEARRKALESLKTTLDHKLESLDSLKNIVNSSIIPRSEGKGIILGEPVNPVSVYQAEIAYYKEQLVIDEALATIDNIEIVQPFFKLNKTNYPRYNFMMAISFLASLFIAYLAVLGFGRIPR